MRKITDNYEPTDVSEGREYHLIQVQSVTNRAGYSVHIF
jgi:hypothetical protein